MSQFYFPGHASNCSSQTFSSQASSSQVGLSQVSSPVNRILWMVLALLSVLVATGASAQTTGLTLNGYNGFDFVQQHTLRHTLFGVVDGAPPFQSYKLILRDETGFINCRKGGLTKRSHVARYAISHNAVLVHIDEPLWGITKDNRLFRTPCMRILVFQPPPRKQVVLAD